MKAWREESDAVEAYVFLKSKSLKKEKQKWHALSILL